MKKEEIDITDWYRILIGDVPPAFLIEVVIRIIFIYALLLISIRLMGKRMAAQLSSQELAALVSLAAAIGVPLLAPDRGLLPALIISILVIAIQRVMAGLMVKNESFERKISNNISVLVADAVLQLEIMMKERVTRERLFAELRSKGVKHLGMVSRLYIEAGGSFSVLLEDKPRPGLCILPEEDVAFRRTVSTLQQTFVCNTCGNAFSNNEKYKADTKCTNCKKTQWVSAVL